MSSQLFSSIGSDSRGYIRQGGIVIQDGDGNDLVFLGLLDDGNSGIEIRNANGRTVFKVSGAGQSVPYAFAPWSSNAALYGTTSADWYEVFRNDFSAMGPRVQYDVSCDPDGGVMDFRIVVAEFGAAFYQTVLVQNANGQHAGHFTIPPQALVSGTDPQGRLISVRLQIRRVSGAGTPTLRLNGPVYNRPA